MKNIIIALLTTSIMAIAAEAPQQPPKEQIGDKGITKEQWMERAAARFEKADANHDGVVTRDEMKAFAKEERANHEEKREDRKGHHDTDAPKQ
jgi:hypothetical protein